MTAIPDKHGQRLMMLGGDIDGLRALASTLYGCVPEAAGLIDGLAAELAELANALEEKAYIASRYGVKIGTDGRPPPVAAGPAADVTAASEQHWALVYRQVYEQAMVQVRHARQQAARQLMDLYAKIEPAPQALASQAEPAMVTGRELLPTSFPRPGVEPARPWVRSQWCGDRAGTPIGTGERGPVGIALGRVPAERRPAGPG